MNYDSYYILYDQFFLTFDLSGVNSTSYWGKLDNLEKKLHFCFNIMKTMINTKKYILQTKFHLKLSIKLLFLWKKNV